VDAAFKAIDAIVNEPSTLLEFSIHAVTEGIDALGEVTVRVQSNEPEPRTFGGHGADTDIMVASAKAYLSAINKMLVAISAPADEREVVAVALTESEAA
jgi:2-isopropylmalate synthase